METMTYTTQPEEVTVSLTGQKSEFANLLRELKTWTPTSGWTEEALELFNKLQEAAGEDAPE